MSVKIWIDGKLYDKADAKISVYDHGLLYGDGVFEGIRVYAGRIFKRDEHLTRLWDSAGEEPVDDPREHSPGERLTLPPLSMHLFRAHGEA